MNKTSLLGKQIFIVLYLLAAAIACIEATVIFQQEGLSSWKFWFLALVFFFSVYMYFVKKKKRLEEKQK